MFNSQNEWHLLKFYDDSNNFKEKNGRPLDSINYDWNNITFGCNITENDYFGIFLQNDTNPDL